MDVTGRTSEEVGQDREVADTVKTLWNTQKSHDLSFLSESARADPPVRVSQGSERRPKSERVAAYALMLWTKAPWTRLPPLWFVLPSVEEPSHGGVNLPSCGM